MTNRLKRKYLNVKYKDNVLKRVKIDKKNKLKENLYDVILNKDNTLKNENLNKPTKSIFGVILSKDKMFFYPFILLLSSFFLVKTLISSIN